MGSEVCWGAGVDDELLPVLGHIELTDAVMRRGDQAGEQLAGLGGLEGAAGRIHGHDPGVRSNSKRASFQQGTAGF